VDKDYQYDVALSFAGEDRSFVDKVANLLRERGVRVFYDRFEEMNLWGKNLYTHLSSIYKDKAKYTVIFISKFYAQKLWTNHERENAQARAFAENREYILPARFDDTEIPGILSTIGYINLNGYTPEKLSLLIYNKIHPEEEKGVEPEEKGASSNQSNQVPGDPHMAVWKNKFLIVLGLVIAVISSIILFNKLKYKEQKNDVTHPSIIQPTINTAARYKIMNYANKTYLIHENGSVNSNELNPNSKKSAQWVFETVGDRPNVYRIKNYENNNYLNIQNNYVGVSDIYGGWESAKWFIDFVNVENKQVKIRCYWHSEYLALFEGELSANIAAFNYDQSTWVLVESE
jgi:hypothetical protein